ncbi:MAG TPA: NUDIX hydrolase, partial [Gammaproteobacteria bacterium]|nr:NUDIX hydrolase [Gammaproteobacteria bacterium]
WITPHEAVRQAEAGTKTIIFPTLRNLEKLARWDTPEEAILAASEATVVPVLPWTEKREDGQYLCI